MSNLPIDRVIAVDWSGAKAKGGRGAIALASITTNGLQVLNDDLSRDEAIQLLLEIPCSERVMAAFDFAFSLPAWYLKEQGIISPIQLWEMLASSGACGAEATIDRCDPPFWGRPGKPRPHESHLGLRKADRIHIAKPVFQIGGAGSVGTGTLRGMPYLLDLQRAGWAIWPFDPPSDRTVVEMYPRQLYAHAGIERVRKSCPDSRKAALKQISTCRLSPAVRRCAIASEHAFDALTAAIALWNWVGDKPVQFPVPDEQERIEGMIFQPG